MWQIDALKADLETQREKANSMESQVREFAEEKTALNVEMESLKQARDAEKKSREEEKEHVQQQSRTLMSAFSQFDKGAAPREVNPEDLESVVSMLQELITNSWKQIQGLQGELAKAREFTQNSEGQLRRLKEEQEAARKEHEVVKQEHEAEKAGHEEQRSRADRAQSDLERALMNLSAATIRSQELQEEVRRTSGEHGKLRERLKQLEAHLGSRGTRASEISERYLVQKERLLQLLDHIGYTVSKEDNALVFQRKPKPSSAAGSLIDQSQSLNKSVAGGLPVTPDIILPEHVNWSKNSNAEIEADVFDMFTRDANTFDVEAFADAVIRRIREIEHLARKWQKEAKNYRDKCRAAQLEAQQKIAFRSFKAGDLALFLPTRSQETRSWAAFNVGAPHYFLHEQEFHNLDSRDWLLARISSVDERVVDLGKKMSDLRPPSSSSDGNASFVDENPFGLSDGLRWYLLEAAEEKPRTAPLTLGLGKSTVASAHVDAKGSIQHKNSSEEGAATRTLTRSLDSRRGSSASKKSVLVTASAISRPEAERSSASDERVVADVQKDLFFGP
jgi:autophagy-related protein 11